MVSADMGGLLVALEGAATLLLIAALLAVMARNRGAIARSWRLGAGIAIAVFALSLPEQLARAWFLDPRAVLGDGPPGSLPLALARQGALLGLLAGLGLQALHGVWIALQTGAAAGEWARVVPGRSLFAVVGPHGWRRLGVALALGASLGAISAPIFHLFGVEAGPDLQQIAATFPGLAEQPRGIQTLLALSAGGVAALAEEITFRGVLLGFLLGTLGRRPWGPAAAGLLVALLWATMHLGMTDAPLLKAGQITLVGVVLAELTRRWGLGAAVGAHLGLNVAGAGTALLLTTLSAP